METTLKTHFTGFGVPQFSPMDNVALTDSGVRQMNSLKISARVRKAKIKNKIKPKKFAPGQGSPQKKVGTFSPEREKPEDCLMAFPDVYSEGAFVTDLDKKSRVLPKVNRSRANAHRPGVGGFVAAGRGDWGKEACWAWRSTWSSLEKEHSKASDCTKKVWEFEKDPISPGNIAL